MCLYKVHEQVQNGGRYVWLYLRPNRRRPVRMVLLATMGDVQGDIPAAWCENCGAEVFAWGEALCSRCKKEGGDPDERNLSRTKSLPKL